MTDRVQAFIDELELAVDAHRRRSDSSNYVRAAIREAEQLAKTLDQLSKSEVAPRSVRVIDLHSLQAELSTRQAPPSLPPLIAKATSLADVLESGMVDGDGERLNTLISEARSLSRPRNRNSRSDRPLDPPIRVLCVDCKQLVSGVTGPITSWRSLRQQVREHERSKHGEYSEALRSELDETLTQLRSNEQLVTAGRYELGPAVTS